MSLASGKSLASGETLNLSADLISLFIFNKKRLSKWRPLEVQHIDSTNNG